MAKNPFKKQSIIDTITNVGVGGAANVAIDYVVDQVDFLKGLGDTTINAVKIVAGAVVGSMVDNKIARAACDGVATVGVSNLISSFMADSGTEGAAGLPYGTIGRVIPGNRAYKRFRANRKVAGCDAAAVMGK